MMALGLSFFAWDPQVGFVRGRHEQAQRTAGRAVYERRAGTEIDRKAWARH
jgi:hypothetical protein